MVRLSNLSHLEAPRVPWHTSLEKTVVAGENKSMKPLRSLFGLVVVFALQTSFARLPVQSTSARDPLNAAEIEKYGSLYGGPNGRLLGYSKEDRKMFEELKKLTAKYPALAEISRKLEASGDKPVRVQIQLAGAGEVTWRVWLRGSDVEIYRIQVSPAAAADYKKQLQSRPDAGRYGYETIGGTK